MAVWAMIGLSALVALTAFRFLGQGWSQAFPDFGAHLDNRWWAFVLHVIAAPVALLLGSLQCIAAIRVTRPAIHRWAGRAYVVAVMIGGLSGLALAINAVGGPVAGAGFGLLSLLWMAFTTQGLRMARARRFADHRRWMVRSFALTFAAVTLRLYLVGFLAGGIAYAPASVYLAWICWVPNLLFAQWWLVRGSTRLPDPARAQQA